MLSRTNANSSIRIDVWSSIWAIPSRTHLYLHTPENITTWLPNSISIRPILESRINSCWYAHDHSGYLWLWWAYDCISIQCDIQTYTTHTNTTHTHTIHIYNAHIHNTYKTDNTNTNSKHNTYITPTTYTTHTTHTQHNRYTTHNTLNTHIRETYTQDTLTIQHTHTHVTHTHVTRTYETHIWHTHMIHKYIWHTHIGHTHLRHLKDKKLWTLTRVSFFCPPPCMSGAAALSKG